MLISTHICMPCPHDLSRDRMARVLFRVPGAYTAPWIHQLSPHPLVGLCMDHSPQYSGRTGGGGEAVQQPASSSALFIRSFTPSHPLHGPRHTYRPGRSLYEGGMGTRGPFPLTHTTSNAGTRAFMLRRARIALYNRLYARSIVTHRRGVGGKIPLWGKGLMERCGQGTM